MEHRQLKNGVAMGGVEAPGRNMKVTSRDVVDVVVVAIVGDASKYLWNLTLELQEKTGKRRNFFLIKQVKLRLSFKFKI